PIYLFIPTPPFSVSLENESDTSLHFWSSDFDGQTPLSDVECELLGLPSLLRVVVQGSEEYSWSNETYENIHKWQVARGFDPTTSDFSEYLGYPVLE
ncbi:hypothetical protein L218DRAFT_841795, partial [Marasmius fiardii PR-910]